MNAVEIAAAVRDRTISPVEITRKTLDSIASWESRIGAWATLDTDGAIAAARGIEQALARGMDPGPLAGVPVGVKDVFDAAGLPTGCGVYRDAAPASRDSTAVARLRSAGAVILGKTVTTAFAWSDPSPTRNPRHPGRTPGGSSSGSGAAVAAGTIPLALGTQTAGSTLRPAAYNGCVGFKPSYGRIGRSGLVPLAPSLDTVGIICATVEDAAVALDSLSAFDSNDAGSLPLPRPRAYELLSRERPGPRFGLVTDAIERSSASMANHLGNVVRTLTGAGAVVQHVSLPLKLMLAVHRIIILSEAASVHRDLTMGRFELPIPLAHAQARVGALISSEVYLRADRLRQRLRSVVAASLAGLDALLLPTATATAPTPETTGDTSLQAPFTLFGMPSISLPSGLDSDGLPFAVQLAGRRHFDADLLAVACWVEQHLDPLPSA